MSEKLKGTIFIWTIENFSCLEDEILSSPSFSSYSITWELRIYPTQYNGGYYINVDLCPENQAEGGTFNCSLAFLDLEGLPLILREQKNCQIDFFSPFRKEFPREKLDYFTEKLFPKNILTVECRIWRSNVEFIQFKSRTARTRVEPVAEETEKEFTWQITGIPSLQPGDTIKERIHKITRRGDTVKIRLFFNAIEHLHAEFKFSLVRIVAKCKISLLGVNGNRITFADKEFHSIVKSDKWFINTFITKDMLSHNHLQFLPNDTLTLVFEFTFSCKVTFSRIVKEKETRYHSPSLPTQDNTDPASETKNSKDNSSEPEPSNASDNSKKPDTSSGSEPLTNINQVLWSMFEEGFLSDFSLRVQDRTFPVHKNILGARSSVFRAMFTADMKEKESSSVDISDVDADTMQRLLKFVYCDSVQGDLQWKSASSLYTAADKYALEPLKQKCSNILMSELCTSSFYGILLLADTYQDQDLKSATLDFIEKNDKLIIGTDPWCKFEETNPQIANDVLRKLYVKKMNG